MFIGKPNESPAARDMYILQILAIILDNAASATAKVISIGSTQRWRKKSVTTSIRIDPGGSNNIYRRHRYKPTARQQQGSNEAATR